MESSSRRPPSRVASMHVYGETCPDGDGDDAPLAEASELANGGAAWEACVSRVHILRSRAASSREGVWCVCTGEGARVSSCVLKIRQVRPSD